MKKRYLLLSLFLLGLLGSCVREIPMPEPFGAREGSVLRFATPGEAIVDIQTKQTLDIGEESNIHNLSVFIFNSAGTKIFSHHYDASNKDTEWRVTNRGNDDTALPTNGNILIESQIDGTNCTIICIANTYAPLDWDAIKDKATIEELEALPINLSTVPSVDRTGSFPMSGRLNNVTLGENIIYTTGDSEKTEQVLQLKRIDAKVKFSVKVADGSDIQTFTPISWQVFRLPMKSYLLEHGSMSDPHSTHQDAADNPDIAPTVPNFFDMAQSRIFDKTDIYHNENSFSFYMLENRRPPKGTPAGGWTYADRDRKLKTSDGLNIDSFEFANDNATYVIITGQLTMKDTGPTTGPKTVGADVRYLIHLGDFSGGKYSDFDIFRNHSYHYTIYINGVNDILTEVTMDNEVEPGATGKVLQSDEAAILTDAHSNAFVITFKEDNFVDPERVSWFVETPFHTGEAHPKQEGGHDKLVSGWPVTEDEKPIDCRWVEFRVNARGADGRYLENRRPYLPWPGNSDLQTYNVSELLTWLLAEYEKKKAGDPDNAFDADGNVRVTVFIGENYYKTNPVDPTDDPKQLWRKFVNKPPRKIFIMANSKVSKDRESILIGAAFSLQQRSIQTVFNVEHPDLASAYGGEFTDELGEKKFYSNNSIPKLGNDDLWNGRQNSLRLWGWTPQDDNGHTHMQTGKGWARWDQYLNVEGTDAQSIFKDSTAFVRYSCISRNRDDDGDGLVDLNEVRWYMGATNQLMGIYLGAEGIDGDARLYQRTAAEQAMGDNAWRQHMLASTTYDGFSYRPRLIWAEQGFTGSQIGMSVMTSWSTRCLRNVGHMRDTDGYVTDVDFSDAPVEAVTDNFISSVRCLLKQDGTVQENYTGGYTTRVFYKFDCSRLNTQSLRTYSPDELYSHTDKNPIARLYQKFESAPVDGHPEVPVTKDGVNVNHSHTMNKYLDDQGGANPFCPKGYRLPNIRELVVYWNLVENTATHRDVDRIFKGYYAFSRTSWSFGEEGDNNKHVGEYGWAASQMKVLMTTEGHTTTQVRCVKDTP